MELYIKKLKTIRKQKKITAEELAKKMGLSRVTIGAWETARRIPAESKIRMLAKALNIAVDEISDLTPDKTISEINLAPLGSSISSVLHRDKEKNLNRQTNLVSGIMNTIKELSDAKLIISTMISALPAIFYIKGSDLKYITASEAFLQNLSLNKNYDVAGKTDYDFFPANEAKINSEMDKAVLASGKSILNQEDYIPGCRKTKWGIFSKIPIYDFEGKIEGLIGYVKDITGHKKAEEKYDRLVNMSPNLICVAGMDGYLKFVNPAWEKVLGYTSEELLSKPLPSFIHPDDRAGNDAEMTRLAAGNLSMDFESRYIHKDGSVRYFLWTSAPIPDEKLIYCIATDITERKHVEEALRVHQVELEMQNEELRRAHLELDALRGRYFNLYDLAPAGFFTLSAKGMILEANVTAAAMLGVTRDKLLKQPISRFILPEDQDIYYLKCKTLAATGKQQAWPLRMLHADGSSFRGYLQAAPAQDGEFMVALSDITGI
ncbi:MAG: PAS domain S-box protein [Victivallaceae bacterium]|jgi:PAS domain S-box-containing protein